MGDDSLAPCDLCGLPGHWEKDCDAVHRHCRAEEEKLRLRVKDLEAINSSTWHPYGGQAMVHECYKCRTPYVDWSVSSHMSCYSCRRVGGLMQESAVRLLLTEAIGETRNAVLAEVADWVDANAGMDPRMIASHFRRLSKGEMKEIA